MYVALCTLYETNFPVSFLILYVLYILEDTLFITLIRLFQDCKCASKVSRDIRLFYFIENSTLKVGTF